MTDLLTVHDKISLGLTLRPNLHLDGHTTTTLEDGFASEVSRLRKALRALVVRALDNIPDPEDVPEVVDALALLAKVEGR